MLIIVYTIAYLWIFWGIYVLVMGIYRAHLAKKLNKLTLTLSIPYVVVGYLIDIISNLTIASIIFLEFPRELLVTDRLIRLKQKSGWRAKVANWICYNVLDPFDPNGDNC